jgi:hypothetical protein
MSEEEQREIAETLFERAREEIRDAIKLEDERRAVLVKNLYRLRALRLARDQNRMRIEEGPSQRR